jgi:L,D-transpeptidase catalytic domain
VVRRWVPVLAFALAVTGCAPTRVARDGGQSPVWRSLPRMAVWPRSEVLKLALRAYRCGRDSGAFEGPLLTIIDYSLPSTERRLWVIDVDRRRMLFHELVAHGQGSGEDRAVSFSNRPGSHKSSLGIFRTEDTYVGGNGYSLRLDGLEDGVNDRARERLIVLHGADYVEPGFVRANGRLGRSWGCPAVRPEVSRPLIDRIKGGSALFVYYPDREWLRDSAFLQCDRVRMARIGNHASDEPPARMRRGDT